MSNTNITVIRFSWHKQTSDACCESVRVHLMTMESSFCFEPITSSALIRFLLLLHNVLIVLSGMVFGAKRGEEKKTQQHETPSVHPLFPLPITLEAIL